MPKRRRERDRPKAGPEALYNPNKRVLLTYESDEEADNQNTAANKAQLLIDRAVSSYADDLPSEIESQAHEVSKPAHNGYTEELAEDEEGNETEYEPKSNDTTLWNRSVSKNIHTGQWAALGSLSYQYEHEDDEEEFESEEEEAMAYLRAVRSERQAMPDFFVAQQPFSRADMYDNGVGDTRGHYEDGAYIAAPTTGPTIPDSAKTIVEPHHAFATALKVKFLEQREQMHIRPSSETLAKSDERHRMSLPKSNNKAYANWLRILKTTAPRSYHIRSMEQAEVVRVLELIQSRFLKREMDITPAMSAWIWSLLARLDDVGTMDGDRIALLREFGKKAVLVQLSFQDPEAAEQLEKMSLADGDAQPSKHTAKDNKDSNASTSEQEGAAESDSTALGAVGADGPEATTNDKEARRTNTLATLDTIIVLVGEVFGQRDLLEFRQPWTEQEEYNEEKSTALAMNDVDVDESGEVGTSA